MTDSIPQQITKICNNIFNKNQSVTEHATFSSFVKLLIKHYEIKPLIIPQWIYAWYLVTGNTLYLFATTGNANNSQFTQYMNDLTDSISSLTKENNSNNILKLQFSRLKSLLAYAISSLILNLFAIVDIPYKIWNKKCPLSKEFAPKFVLDNDLFRGLLAIAGLVLSPILYHLIPNKTSTCSEEKNTDFGAASLTSFLLFWFELITTLVMIPLTIIIDLASTGYHSLQAPAAIPKKIGQKIIQDLIELFKGAFALWLPISLFCIALGYQPALLPFGVITYLILGSSVPVITQLALIKTILISFTCCYIWNLKQPSIFKESSFQKTGGAAALLLLFLVYMAPLTATFVYLKLTGIFLTAAIVLANQQFSTATTTMTSNSDVALQLLTEEPATIKQADFTSLESSINLPQAR